MANDLVRDPKGQAGHPNLIKNYTAIQSDAIRAHLQSIELGKTESEKILLALEDEIGRDTGPVRVVIDLVELVRAHSGSIPELRMCQAAIADVAAKITADATMPKDQRARLMADIAKLLAHVGTMTSMKTRVESAMKNVGKGAMSGFGAAQKSVAATLQNNPSLLFRLAGKMIAPGAAKSKSTIDQDILGTKDTIFKRLAGGGMGGPGATRTLGEDGHPIHEGGGGGVGAASGLGELLEIDKGILAQITELTELSRQDKERKVKTKEAGQRAASEGKSVTPTGNVIKEKEEKKGGGLFGLLGGLLGGLTGLLGGLVGKLTGGLTKTFDMIFGKLPGVFESLGSSAGKAIAGAVATEIAGRLVNNEIDKVNKNTGDGTPDSPDKPLANRGAGLGKLDRETQTELDAAGAALASGNLLTAAGLAAFAGARNIWKQLPGIHSLLGGTDANGKKASWGETLGSVQDLAGVLMTGNSKNYYDTKAAETTASLLPTSSGSPTKPTPTPTPTAPVPTAQPPSPTRDNSSPETQPSTSPTHDQKIVRVVKSGMQNHKPYIMVQNADGTMERRFGDRNTRDNNPGNIRWSTSKRGVFADSVYGAIGNDGDNYAVFPTLAAGSAAQSQLLLSKKYRDLNPTQLVHSYAPSSDKNDEAAYVSSLASVGDKTPSQMSPEELTNYKNLITRHEGNLASLRVMPVNNDRSAGPVEAQSAASGGRGGSAVIGGPTLVASGGGGGVPIMPPQRLEVDNPDASVRAIRGLNAS
jgi:hypothetical protein